MLPLTTRPLDAPKSTATNRPPPFPEATLSSFATRSAASQSPKLSGECDPVVAGERGLFVGG